MCLREQYHPLRNSFPNVAKVYMWIRTVKSIFLKIKRNLTRNGWNVSKEKCVQKLDFNRWYFCRFIFHLNYKIGLEIASSFLLFLPFSFFSGIKQEREKRERKVEALNKPLVLSWIGFVGYNIKHPVSDSEIRRDRLGQHSLQQLPLVSMNKKLMYLEKRYRDTKTAFHREKHQKASC